MIAAPGRDLRNDLEETTRPGDTIRRDVVSRLWPGQEHLGRRRGRGDVALPDRETGLEGMA